MVDINQLEKEIEGWTRTLGIHNRQGPKKSMQNANAFAHAYASAHIAYENGRLVSNMLGNGREYRSFLTGSAKAMIGRPNWSLSGVFRDGHRDMFNNHVGNQIARYAKRHGLPKGALGYLVARQARSD